MIIKNLFYRLNKHPMAHGIYAAVVLLPALAVGFFWITSSHIIVGYYMRELRDAQSKAGIDSHKYPFALINPLKWHRASQWDYFSVLAAVAALGFVKEICIFFYKGY